jgi:hypothetical protein
MRLKSQRAIANPASAELAVTAAIATTPKTHSHAAAPNGFPSFGLLLSRRRTGAEDAGECVLIEGFRLQQRLR